MNEIGVAVVMGFVGIIVVICLRGNSQHRADKAENRQAREEWEAEKKSVGQIGCTIVVVVVFLIIFFGLIATKG